MTIRSGVGRTTGWKVGSTSSSTPLSLKIAAVREFGSMVSNDWKRTIQHGVPEQHVLKMSRTPASFSLGKPSPPASPRLEALKPLPVQSTTLTVVSGKNASRPTLGLLHEGVDGRLLCGIRPAEGCWAVAFNSRTKQTTSGVNRRHFGERYPPAWSGTRADGPSGGRKRIGVERRRVTFRCHN